MSGSSTDLTTSESQNFDAKQMAEDIQAGEQKAPHVDVEADYNASKEYSVSDIDRTGEGAQAAEKATAPGHAMPQTETNKSETPASSDPSDYRQMAQDVNPQLKQ